LKFEHVSQVTYEISLKFFNISTSAYMSMHLRVLQKDIESFKSTYASKELAGFLHLEKGN
jgi:hypothetical protein